MRVGELRRGLWTPLVRTPKPKATGSNRVAPAIPLALVSLLVADFDQLLACDARDHVGAVLDGFAERLELDLGNDRSIPRNLDDAVGHVRIRRVGVGPEAKVHERVAVVEAHDSTDGGGEDVRVVAVLPDLPCRHGGEVELELESAGVLTFRTMQAVVVDH